MSSNFLSFIFVHCNWALRKWLFSGPSSVKPAISCGTIDVSSTPEHGRHMHSSGAFVETFDRHSDNLESNTYINWNVGRQSYLAEFAFTWFCFWTKQRNCCFSFARFLAAHTRSFHLPNFASRYLRKILFILIRVTVYNLLPDGLIIINLRLIITCK